MLGYENGLSTIKMVKDQIQCRSQSLLNFGCTEYRLNLSVNCGGQFSVESTDVFSDVFFRSLHGAFTFIAIYHSINVKLFELPQSFTFRIIL